MQCSPNTRGLYLPTPEVIIVVAERFRQESALVLVQGRPLAGGGGDPRVRGPQRRAPAEPAGSSVLSLFFITS